MGLISGLLTLPLAPVRGVVWIGEQIAEEADRELDDEARVRRELGRLNLEHELGRLTREEFEAREDALLVELDALHSQRGRRATIDGD
jgi:Gas vesicle protein G